MKAIILCAGLGTRMRPLTDTTPKCMLPVGGKPLLHHTLTSLAKAGVTDVAINLHHLPARITNDLHRGYRFGLRITYSYEHELLGTAGAIKRLEWWLDEEPFFVVYGDEWTTLDFADLWDAHRQYGGMATVVVHPVAHGGGRNLLDVTTGGEVTFMWPKEARRIEGVQWAASGIYVFARHAITFWHSWQYYDLESDWLRDMLKLAMPIWAYFVGCDEVADIGTSNGWMRACTLAGSSW